MIAKQLTLTTAATLYGLAQGTNALLTSLLVGNLSCRQLKIQSDPGNGAALVWVGDGTMATSGVGGQKLTSGTSIEWTSTLNSVSLIDKYFTTDTPGSKINILVEFL